MGSERVDMFVGESQAEEDEGKYEVRQLLAFGRKQIRTVVIDRHQNLLCVYDKFRLERHASAPPSHRNSRALFFLLVPCL